MKLFEATIIAFVAIIILSILFFIFKTLFEVDWRNKWKIWLKELMFLYVGMFFATITINEQCVNMIYYNGFTRETIIQIIFNSIIFTLVCLPLLNIRNSKD